VLPPSLYHLIVPKADRAVPVISAPDCQICAVRVVLPELFLKVVPLLLVIDIDNPSSPFGPCAPSDPVGDKLHENCFVKVLPSTVTGIVRTPC
jgi:hypothetical protein